jgi:hypothetical protein
MGCCFGSMCGGGYTKEGKGKCLVKNEIYSESHHGHDTISCISTNLFSLTTI